jgi:type IV pilus assembly protein PilO
MEFKLPTTQRDQLMLIVIILAAAGIYLFHMYVYGPRALQLDAVQARVDSLTAQNEIARRDVARGAASEIRAEADRYGRILTLMRQLVPTANEVPTLIEQISTAARRVGLELEDIRPLGIIRGDVFDTHKYNMSVTGPYHRIGEFFTGVGSMTRIVAPMNVNLLRAQSQTGMPRGETRLEAQFEIQTYVAKRGGS